MSNVTNTKSILNAATLAGSVGKKDITILEWRSAAREARADDGKIDAAEVLVFKDAFESSNKSKRTKAAFDRFVKEAKITFDPPVTPTGLPALADGMYRIAVDKTNSSDTGGTTHELTSASVHKHGSELYVMVRLNSEVVLTMSAKDDGTLSGKATVWGPNPKGSWLPQVVTGTVEGSGKLELKDGKLTLTGNAWHSADTIDLDDGGHAYGWMSNFAFNGSADTTVANVPGNEAVQTSSGPRVAISLHRDAAGRLFILDREKFGDVPAYLDANGNGTLTRSYGKGFITANYALADATGTLWVDRYGRGDNDVSDGRTVSSSETYSVKVP